MIFLNLMLGNRPNTPIDPYIAQRSKIGQIESTKISEFILLRTSKHITSLYVNLL
ncbi:hypothetical protein AGABI2DRAFT_133507 [Agaricus bisporus var. bisporus H97]|uniref:hypothetical protein n=1 Tax=Agaricus bisporus var. bisporus (strain H97 / ATCC MYA-4626 / FGSC 10389) TaxID=936046 RepID=UPI00029F7673|nr:hypothetical protein AGABI2DRAFT_133507 [Agaricus bisporus var. bisporus H97]EKV51861.1 hypothetical protein AGABI2DRAFT_133507 [Agaricus bisporus var. bisporus H97]